MGALVEVAKDYQKPSAGRRVAAGLGGALHGAVAGQSGTKLRAAGNEGVSSYGGGAVARAAVSPAMRAMAHSGRGQEALGVGALANLVGGSAGAQVGLRRNLNRGYLKGERQAGGRREKVTTAKAIRIPMPHKAPKPPKPPTPAKDGLGPGITYKGPGTVGMRGNASVQKAATSEWGTGMRRVQPRLPDGKYASHVNDLVHVKVASKAPKDSRVQRFTKQPNSAWGAKSKRGTRLS